MARYRQRLMVVEAEKPSPFELMDVVDPRTGKHQKVPYPADAMVVTFPNGQRTVMPAGVFLSQFELIDGDDEPGDGGEPAAG